MANYGANVTDPTVDTEEDGSEEENRSGEAGNGSGETERLQKEADARATMREELEVDIERRLRGEFEQAARIREEKERAARIRAERERAAQNACTPRRGGPPAPSSPASEQGKKLHLVMKNLWQDTEMSVTQAYQEYEEAIAEVERIISRDPRGA